MQLRTDYVICRIDQSLPYQYKEYIHLESVNINVVIRIVVIEYTYVIKLIFMWIIINVSGYVHMCILNGVQVPWQYLKNNLN